MRRLEVEGFLIEASAGKPVAAGSLLHKRLAQLGAAFGLIADDEAGTPQDSRVLVVAAIAAHFEHPRRGAPGVVTHDLLNDPQQGRLAVCTASVANRHNVLGGLA